MKKIIGSVMGAFAVSLCTLTSQGNARVPQTPAPTPDANSLRELTQRNFQAGDSFVHGMDSLMEAVAERLKVELDAKYLAEELESGWQRERAAFVDLEFSALGFGDYTPLVQWLADMTAQIRTVFGSLDRFPELRDLDLMNFSIPVALHPGGRVSTGETWDRTDYRLHFVPLIEVVTYWGSLKLCQTLADRKFPQARRLCPQVAKTLRTQIGQRIAPAWGERIYDRAHSRTPSPS